MEDVLDLYHQPYDPANPVVCFDETNKQLTADVREPIAAVPGRQARYDYEYKRKGVRNLFIFRGGLVCLNSAARFDKWNRAAVR